jgi:hypothetical protein
MTVWSGLDAAGRSRSPATLAGYHAGRPPRNKGMRYPADPPTVEEIVAVMRHAADDRHGWRVRAMIVVLWRAGLRIQEALALAEHDLDHRRGSLLVRNGKGGRRREVGMDEWGWQQLGPWLTARAQLPVAPLFCIIDGPTRGRPWSGAAVRSEFRRLAARAGSGAVLRRTSCATRMRSSSPARALRSTSFQRQLGHANLGTTSIYLQGIDPEAIITAVRTRRAPMMSASAAAALIKHPTTTSGSATALPLQLGEASTTRASWMPLESAAMGQSGSGGGIASSGSLAARGWSISWAPVAVSTGGFGARPLQRQIRRAGAVISGELSSDSQRVCHSVGDDEHRRVVRR